MATHRKRLSLLTQAVLASTLFCAAPITSHAIGLVPLDSSANGKNSGNIPDLGLGYNYIAPNVSFTILDGDHVGTTLVLGLGTSVDNNTLDLPIICSGTGCANDTLNFAGNATVGGAIGTSNPIAVINLQGATGKKVIFDGNVNVGSINFAHDATAQFFNTAVITANIDNLSGTSNQGIVQFQGGGTINGNLGETKSLNQMTVNAGQLLPVTLFLTKSIVNVGTVHIYDNDVLATTLVLNNSAMNFNANVTAETDNLDIFNALNATSVTGNIGTTGHALQLFLVGANADLAFTGDVIAGKTQFQGDHVLNVGSGSDFTGDITTLTNNTGTLQFLGDASVSGDVGTVALKLASINLQGANNTVSLYGDVNAGNINFITGATSKTLLALDDGITISGPIRNTTGTAGIGAIHFLGTGMVNGLVGAVNSVSNIGIDSNKTVTFTNNINVGSGSLSFADDGTALLADGLSITGPVDSQTSNEGNLVFQGGGNSSGDIGATKALNTIVANSTGLVSKDLTLTGNTIKALTLLVSDNGVAPTSLTLDNPAMKVSANIQANTNNLDVINVTNAALITGDIGTALKIFDLINVAANTNLTIDGDIYATDTQFLGDHTLILGDGTIVTGNIDSSLANQGTLQFAGNGTVTGTIGKVNVIKLLNLGGTGKTVNFNDDIFITDLHFIGDSKANLIDGILFDTDSDNTSGSDAIGSIVLAGGGTISGLIGQTKALKAIQVNNLGGVKTLTLDSSKINGDIGLIGDGTNPTTLLLNNASLILNGSITSKSNSLDIVNATKAAIINGDIGALNHAFDLVEVGANADLTVTGDIYADTLLFKGDHILSLGNGSALNALVNTSVNNEGTLLLIGDTSLNLQIGTSIASLKALKLNNPINTTVDLNTNLYVGDVNVNGGGALSINDQRTITGNLVIGSGSQLKLGPNSNPSKVIGNIALSAGSILDVDLNNTLLSGSIESSGPANINPSAVLSVHNLPVMNAISNPIPVLIGGPGSIINAIPVIGVNNNNGSLLFSVTTQAAGNQLNLIIKGLPVVDYANLPDTKGIAGFLDAILNSGEASGKLAQVINQLPIFTNQAELNQALATLAPIADGAIVNEVFQTQQQSFQVILGDMSGNSSNSGNASTNSRERMIRATGSRSGTGSSSSSNSNSSTQTRNRNLIGQPFGDFDNSQNGAWVRLFGQHANQTMRSQIPGYKDNMLGLAIGADTTPADNILVGIAFSYADLDIHSNISAAKTEVNSYQTLLYGQYDFEIPLYISAVAGMAFNHYVTHRQVFFGNAYLTPKSDYPGWQSGVELQLAYDYQTPGLLITPLATMMYSHLDLGSYTETGAGTANQTVNSASFNLLRGGVGARLSSVIPCYDTLIEPQAHANVYYDFVSDTMSLSSQFVGGGPSFVTLGAEPVRNLFNIGVKVAAFDLARHVIVSVDYDFYGKQDYSANEGYLRVRYEWC